jgi:hypothetical protein
MRKLIGLWVLSGLCFITGIRAQPEEGLFLGTKTTYAPLQERYSPPPAGFEPVFVNYVGRHGARHLTKPGGEISLVQLLATAVKSHALTAKGTELWNRVNLLISIEKENYGNITLSGAAEQTGIATRMLQQYPSVFKGRGIQIVTTGEVRTQQSCRAFLKAFTGYNRAAVSIHTPADENNEELRFFDLSPAYLEYEKSGSWAEKMDLLENKEVIRGLYPALTSQFFLAPFLDSLIRGQLVLTGKKGKTVSYTAADFTIDLYALYCISYSLQQERAQKKLPASAMDFRIFFTAEQLDVLDKITGAADFLKKGPGTCDTCLQVTDAVPLLVDMMNTTDDFIKKNDRDAVLRFAHAETIAPFAVLLGIKGASETTADIENYRAVWNVAKIIPLSANIQFILFKNKQNDYLVKVLLNEKEARLPVSLVPVNSCYYRWKEVRAFYLAKLKKLQVGLQDDMHQYLLNLK